MSVHTPKPGMQAQLIDSMHRFGAAGRGQPGFIEALTLRDASSGKLFGVARWESEAAWRAGVEQMRAAVRNDPFGEWEVADPEGFLLEVV
jgi:heme-degrading monooxygenase HmoA